MRRIFAGLQGPAWLTIAHGSHALFQWLLVIVLGRLFGMADLGSYTSAMAVLTPIVLVAGLNSRGVQLADVTGRWTLREAFMSRVVGITLAFIGVLMYTALAVREDSILLWLVIFCRVAAEAIAEPVHTWLIASRKFSTFALTYVVRSALSVGIFTFLAVSGASLVGCLAGWTGIWVAVLLLRDLRFGGFVTVASLLPVSPKQIASFARASLPLAIVGVINSLYVSIPLLFLTGQYGLEQVGVYAALSYVNMAIGLIVGAVTLSSARATATAYAQKLNAVAMRRVHRQLLFLGACCLPALIAMYISGEQLLEVLYDTRGTGYRPVILTQLVAVVLQSAASVFGVAATAAGRNRTQVAIGGLCVTLQFILCLFLIPGLGLLGAAVGSVTSFALKAVLLYCILPRPKNGVERT